MVKQEIPEYLTFPEYIAAHLKIPFKWGMHDCVTFAVGWAEIVTGRDIMPPITWTTEEEAMQVVKSLGGLVKAFDDNFTRTNPQFARDGYLTIVGKSAFLFSGSHIVGAGTNGLAFRSRMEAKCAWSF
jgi:hypothetical protein